MLCGSSPDKTRAHHDDKILTKPIDNYKLLRGSREVATKSQDQQNIIIKGAEFLKVKENFMFEVF